MREREREAPMKEGASFFVILSRSLSSQCPVCGRGRLFSRLTRVRRMAELFMPLKQCAACGFSFGRQPGYYLGVVTPILPILALMMGAVFAGVSYFVIHHPLETTLAWGGVGVGFGLVVFFRTAIAVYVALDHAIDPPKQGEDSAR